MHEDFGDEPGAEERRLERLEYLEKRIESLEEEIYRLQVQKEEAVTGHDFELAATLRDKEVSTKSALRSIQAEIGNLS